ncbi:UNVERIFIED_CONTAM: hypothetical protein KB581_11085, partial [Streptococcus canis]
YQLPDRLSTLFFKFFSTDSLADSSLTALLVYDISYLPVNTFLLSITPFFTVLLVTPNFKCKLASL